MRNRQTFTVGHLNIVLASIAPMDVMALEIVGEVVRSPGFHQPWSRVVVGVHGGIIVETLVVVVGVVVIEVIIVVKGLVPPITANLTARTLLLAITASATVTAKLLAIIAAVIRVTLPLLVSIPSGTTPTILRRGVLRTARTVGAREVAGPRSGVCRGCPLGVLKLMHLKRLEQEDGGVELCVGHRAIPIVREPAM